MTRFCTLGLLLVAGACHGANPAAPADAGPDAAPDAGPDAASPLTCGPEVEIGGEYAHCLGCDQPCDERRPFCCLFTCCSDECGSPDNDCAPNPDRLAGRGVVSPYEPCGELVCNPSAPFCCADGCCAEECGTVDNRCTQAP